MHPTETKVSDFSAPSGPETVIDDDKVAFTADPDAADGFAADNAAAPAGAADQVLPVDDDTLLTGDLPSSAEEALEVMVQDWPEETEELIEEWAEDAPHQWAQAQRAVDALVPAELVSLVDAAGLGSHPAVVRFLAELGRDIDAPDSGRADPGGAPTDDDDSEAPDPLSRQMEEPPEDIAAVTATASPGTRAEALELQHAKLTAALHDALDRNDRMDANRLDRERSLIAQRLVRLEYQAV